MNEFYYQGSRRTKMPSSLSAAAILFLITIAKGQFQYHGAKKQYLLVEIPGEFDKKSLEIENHLHHTTGWLVAKSHKNINQEQRSRTLSKSPPVLVAHLLDLCTG